MSFAVYFTMQFTVLYSIITLLNCELVRIGSSVGEIAYLVGREGRV